ncbi:MAG: hypothetical protein AAF810_06245 [Cyanobacteria bacterium P01_D01_bin.36]
MATRSKATPAADESVLATKKAAAKKTTTQKTTTQKTTTQKTKSRTAAKKRTKSSAATSEKLTALEKPLPVDPAVEQMPLASVMDDTERLSGSPLVKPPPTEASVKSDAEELSKVSVPQAFDSSLDVNAAVAKARSQSADFRAIDCVGDDVWQPSAAIPELDEATYKAQKAQAEAQRRAIEVASLNLQNINDLHQLEQQSIDVAISVKNNETRSADLSGAEIERRIQLEANGEKSQLLRQATAKREAATRESDYVDQFITLKDQNFELDIQQAQDVFAQKAARYRAQLTGQE